MHVKQSKLKQLTFMKHFTCLRDAFWSGEWGRGLRRKGVGVKRGEGWGKEKMRVGYGKDNKKGKGEI